MTVPRRLRPPRVLGAALLAALACCGAPEGDGAASTGGPPEVGARAPEVPGRDPRFRLVLVFYRGYWCPYCHNQLVELQDRLPEIERAEARVIAVSVEPARLTEGIRRLHGLAFPVRSDPDGALARAYGVWEEAGWATPAVFVLDRDGTVLWRRVSSDPHVRPVVADLAKALEFVPEDRETPVYYRPEDGPFTSPPLPEPEPAPGGGGR